MLKLPSLAKGQKETVVIYKCYFPLVKLWLFYILLFLRFVFLFLLAPGCPPTNIRLETVQSTKLLVRWDGLPQGCENGQLGGYKVYYRKSYKYYWDVAYHVTTGPSDTQVMITGLNQLAEYSVWITAFTFKEGPKSQSQSTVIGWYIWYCLMCCFYSYIRSNKFNPIWFLHEMN